jgi:hypothetical protein
VPVPPLALPSVVEFCLARKLIEIGPTDVVVVGGADRAVERKELLRVLGEIDHYVTVSDALVHRRVHIQEYAHEQGAIAGCASERGSYLPNLLLAHVLLCDVRPRKDFSEHV